MEFELFLFHTDASTDVYVRLESPRTRASSETEPCGKLQKMLCTPLREKTSCALKAKLRQHRDDVIFGELADASGINQP